MTPGHAHVRNAHIPAFQSMQHTQHARVGRTSGTVICAAAVHRLVGRRGAGSRGPGLSVPSGHHNALLRIAAGERRRRGHAGAVPLRSRLAATSRGLRPRRCDPSGPGHRRRPVFRRVLHRRRRHRRPAPRRDDRVHRDSVPQEHGKVGVHGLHTGSHWRRPRQRHSRGVHHGGADLGPAPRWLLVVWSRQRRYAWRDSWSGRDAPHPAGRGALSAGAPDSSRVRAPESRAR